MGDYSLEDEVQRILEHITSEEIYQHVLQYALTLTHNRPEAEDLVQHAYMETQSWLLEHPGSSIDYPEAWLKKIVKNRFFNTKRGRLAQSITSLDALQQRREEEDGFPLFQPPALSLDEPEYMLTALEGEEELKVRVQQAIAATGLPMKGKQIALLHFVEGMDVPELAYRFQISENSVQGYLNRCRYELRLHSR